jgi:acetyltransferase-like isoleucine patch superfamily enzyme
MSGFRMLKRLVFAVAAVVVSPAVLAARAESAFGGGESVFSGFAELFSMVPGRPGTLLRAAYYAGTLRQASWETSVGFGTVFVHRAASLGRHASLGRYCVIGEADIGESVMIGSRVSVPSGKRQHLDDDGRLSAGAGRFERVAIGAGCWIGDGAVVMADVGPTSIVAAGSIVSSPMPAGVTLGGNPARVIRDRPIATAEAR